MKLIGRHILTVALITISTFLFSICPKESSADLFTIEIKNATDSPETAGDYTVSGVVLPPGETFKLLELKKSNSESQTYQMKDLWNTLNDSGIVSTYTLGFGFDLNETGAPGSNYVKIQSLTMTFELPDDPDNSPISFLLDPDGNDFSVNVYNYTQGTQTFEALFRVNLAFDFMSSYNADSTEDFFISSTIDNTSDGPEIYMLSTFGSGLIGLVGIRRKIKK